MANDPKPVRAFPEQKPEERAAHERIATAVRAGEWPSRADLAISAAYWCRAVDKADLHPEPYASLCITQARDNLNLIMLTEVQMDLAAKAAPAG